MRSTKSVKHGPTWAQQRRRPEIALIVSCARLHLDPTNQARIWALLQERLDWDAILEIARPHGILPFLYRHLSTEGVAPAGAIPPAAMTKLAQWFQSNVRRNLLLTGTLLRLVDIMNRHDIPVVPLKGPVLAQQVYGNISLRRFSDLDFFVCETDVPQIHDLLSQAGFGLDQPMTPIERVVRQRSSSECGYHNTAGSIHIEIHHNLTAPTLPGRQTLAPIWATLPTITFQNTAVRTLPPEDLLLYLACHGTKHVWERLEWICCIAEMLQRRMILDWDAVWEQARTRRLTRPLMIALALADSVLDAPIPMREAIRVRADVHAQRLAAIAKQRLFARNGEKVASSEFVWYSLQVYETPWDKIRSCSFRMFTPTTADLDFLPLPVVLHPLYKVVRPVRLAMRYGPAMMRTLLA